MSVFSDVMAALREVLTMEHRVAELTKEVAELKTREQNTRERLIRLEVIIEEARRASAAKRLPQG